MFLRTNFIFIPLSPVLFVLSFPFDQFSSEAELSAENEYKSVIRLKLLIKLQSKLSLLYEGKASKSRKDCWCSINVTGVCGVKI